MYTLSISTGVCEYSHHPQHHPLLVRQGPSGTPRWFTSEEPPCPLWKFLSSLEWTLDFLSTLNKSSKPPSHKIRPSHGRRFPVLSTHVLITRSLALFVNHTNLESVSGLQVLESFPEHLYHSWNPIVIFQLSATCSVTETKMSIHWLPDSYPSLVSSNGFVNHHFDPDLGLYQPGTCCVQVQTWHRPGEYVPIKSFLCNLLKNL